MKAISAKVVEVTEEHTVVNAFIVADSAPGTLPTTGAGIDGMTADQVFAPFSMIYVVDPTAAHQLYIANESGVFVPQ